MICLLMLSVTAAAAQDENRRLTVSGQLVDADLKEPVIYATIQMFTASDSTFVGGSVTNDANFFAIPNLFRNFATTLINKKNEPI